MASSPTSETMGGSTSPVVIDGVHEDEGSDLGGQRVPDHRKQQACTVFGMWCHCGAGVPALQRVCDRQPARRSDERALDEH